MRYKLLRYFQSRNVYVRCFEYTKITTIYNAYYLYKMKMQEELTNLMKCGELLLGYRYDCDFQVQKVNTAVNFG